MLPPEGDPTEGVEEGVIVGQAEGDGGGVDGAGKAEAAGGGGGRGGGAEVELDGVVELVGVDAVDLGDVEVAVGREVVGEAVDEFEERESELWGENGGE